MFRPRLDHKYFTSDTYWAKWNYLSKWDSNSMTSKDIVVDGVLKNPSITTSYVENQWASSNAEELTIIIDASKTTIDKFVGFRNNDTVKKLTVILLNVTDNTIVKNLTYVLSNTEIFNIIAYDKQGNKLNSIKYSTYLVTSAHKLKELNAPTIKYISGDAFYYECESLKVSPDIDLSQCEEAFTRICNCGLPRIPFKNVGVNMYWGSLTTSTNGSLMPNVTEAEWVRFFTEDLKTWNSGTHLLKLGDNLSRLSEATKKIATDKGWTLA